MLKENHKLAALSPSLGSRCVHSSRGLPSYVLIATGVRYDIPDASFLFSLERRLYHNRSMLEARPDPSPSMTFLYKK